MRTQITAVIVFMLLFAGVGSSSLLMGASAQPKSLTAIQREKRIGPKPTPRWFWRWTNWRLGEHHAKGHPLQARLRPSTAPRQIPAWAWERLHFYLRARSERAVTVHAKTTRHATASDTTGIPSGGETYERAISYTQTRPSFTPKRTINVSNASQLQSAISTLQPGDLVRATGSFTVSGETMIKKRLSSPAELDLTGVRFLNSSGKNSPAVWLDNVQNLYMLGGDASTADSGGTCINVYGSQHVLWWGFTAHDCGGQGFAAQAIGGPVDHNDFQGAIWKVGQNLAWDPHPEKGTGLHGANLWDANQAGNFTNNRFTFDMHDIPTGACVEFGNEQPSSLATGNVLYLKCVNATDVALTQTGGNALQCWGDTDTLGLDVKYLEGDNLQGHAFWAGGVLSGQTLKGVTIEYGRASNTNLNPRYSGQTPWDLRWGVVYREVLPTA